MFNSGCGYIGRVFIGETHGKVFADGALTPEAVLESMGQITDTGQFDIHPTTDSAGARLIRFVAEVHPELAEILAKR